MRWTIDRQELVLFHARHKHLRFFYEDTDAATRGNSDRVEFTRYRQQAQEILGALRDDVLNRLPIGAEVSLSNDSQGRDTPREEKTGQLRIKLPENLSKEIMTAYCLCWRASLDYEGLKKDTAPYKSITALIEKLKNGEKDFTVPGLTKSTLVYLGSSLPILPHWDVPGIFFAQSKETPKTLFSSIREYTRPIYAAQLKYSFQKILNRQPTLSEDLLGYSVRLRIGYSEAEAHGAPPIFTVEDDYYTYCHIPEPGEKALYRAYALLIDRLNLALQGIETEEEEKILFYIGYPITTSLGRTHFWHIWVNPEDPRATLKDLWTSWWPLHKHFIDWPTLHPSLATELEQIDIAYAQGAFLHDIKEPPQNVRNLNEDSSIVLVCSHGHMLFPAECFCTKQNKWEYVDYHVENLFVSDKEQLNNFAIKDIKNMVIGQSWEPAQKNLKDEKCKTCLGHNFSDEAIRFKADLPRIKSSIYPNLLDQRYRRLVKQQQFLAEQMLDAYSLKLGREEEERRRVAERLTLLLTLGVRWPPEMLAKLGAGENLQILDEGDAPTFLGSKITYARQIEECLFKSNSPRKQLLSLMSERLHVFLSNVLECHPVKGYTHDMPSRPENEFLANWTKDKIRDVLTKYIASIQNQKQHWSQIEDVNKPLIKEVNQHLNAINDALLAWMKLIEDGENINKSLLDSVHVNGSHPAAKLLNLRARNSDDIRDKVKPTLGKKLSAIRNATTKRDGSQFVRTSLPMSVVFQSDQLNKLIAFITEKAKGSISYRIFGLPLSKVMPWRPVLFRNYLAFTYNLHNLSNHYGKCPIVFVQLEEYLKKFGGNLFVIFKEESKLHWRTIQQSGDSNTLIEVLQSDCWPDLELHEANRTEYELLFHQESWNVIVLWTYDGYYMPEGE